MISWAEFGKNGAFVRQGQDVYFYCKLAQVEESKTSQVHLFWQYFFSPPFQNDQGHQSNLAHLDRGPGPILSVGFQNKYKLTVQEALEWLSNQEALLTSEDRIIKWKKRKKNISTHVELAQNQSKDFEYQVEVIQEKINKREIDKAVAVDLTWKPWNTEEPFDEFEKIKMIQNVLHSPDSVWPYGFWTESCGGGPYGVIGVTPEVLFELNDKELETMALAGTSKNSNVDKNELVQSQKNLKEHHWVVKNLNQMLSHFGRVTQSDIQVIGVGLLSHLKTNFKVTGVLATPKDLIKALHPTAALGVFPKDRGYQWLKDISKNSEYRMAFGAPIAFNLNATHTLCLVQIRNIYWTNQGWCVGAGAGIVTDSQFLDEWEEIQLKKKFTLDLIFKPRGV